MAKYRSEPENLDGNFKSSDSMQNKAFGAGDVLLVILAMLLVAVLILLATRALPQLREAFDQTEEELFVSVEYPIKNISESDYPRKEEPWVLLDSDGATFTVHTVEISEDKSVCRVVLKRNAVYQDGVGYTVADTHIAVGTTLYFRKGVNADQVVYFAVSVIGLNSARFPVVTIPETEETIVLPEPESSLIVETDMPESSDIAPDTPMDSVSDGLEGGESNG